MADWWPGVTNRNKQVILVALCGAVGLLSTWAACLGYDLHLGAVCPPDGLTIQSAYDTFLLSAAAYGGINAAYATGGMMLRPNKE